MNSKCIEQHECAPPLSLTLAQYCVLANTTRASIYKLPPEQRPPFRKIHGKAQITLQEAQEHLRQQPLSTWDDQRGANLKRRGHVAA